MMMSSRLAMMSAPARQSSATDSVMLWFTQEDADVVICCSDGIELKAHQRVIRRSPWFACTFDIQRMPTSDIKYLQLEERASVMRPLLAFCYGVELPLLKKGPKSENQMRNLVDLYHANHWKFHVPKLAITCEAALANPGNEVESPGRIGEKSPIHGVVSRMLSAEAEDRADQLQDIHHMGNPGGPLFSAGHSAADKDEQCHRGITNSQTSPTSPFWTINPLDSYHRTLEDEQERRGRTTSAETSYASQARSSGTVDANDIAEISASFPERRGIPIHGAPTMTRLRDCSPGGTPYSSFRLYYEILTMLGPLGMPSPMLDPEFDPPMGTCSPDSVDSLGSWGLSMLPFLQDRMTPPEDTVYLIPSPLRPLGKRKKTSSGNGSGLYGPRPLLPGHGSKRSVTLQETEAKTLTERPSNMSLKSNMFSSLRGATRRAFHGARPKR